MIVIIANAIDFIAALLQVGSGYIKKKSKIQQDKLYLLPLPPIFQ